MTMQKGKIGVTTENIFPVIKKFLYSDHDIFLREMVSNAIDATQKLKTLASCGEFKGELGDLKVEVKLDKDNGTLTISDHGIGMTAEDVDKYINQIAFSGAEEFLAKYKDNANAIIGHFGLGFYSAFMVADRVTIETLSGTEGAVPVKWTSEDGMAFTMEDGSRTQRGTDVILHISEEEKATGGAKGIFSFGKVYYGCVAEKRQDNRYRAGDKEHSYDKPQQDYCRKRLIEYFPLVLQENDDAYDLINYVNELRNLSPQYNAPTNVPLPLHYLGDRIKEYISFEE